MPDVKRNNNGQRTYLQSVLLRKTKYKTKKDVIKYLDHHGSYSDGIETGSNWQFWRCRQINPDDQNYYYRVLPVSHDVRIITAYLKHGSASHK